jgi:hypothetical protein
VCFGFYNFIYDFHFPMFEVWFARVCVPGVGYSESPMPSIQYHSHVVKALDHSGVGWWGGLRLWETGSQGSGAERCERYPPCCGINFITSSNKSAKQDEAAVSPTLWIANFETWSSGPQAVMGFPPHIPTHQQRLTW